MNNRNSSAGEKKMLNNLIERDKYFRFMLHSVDIILLTAELRIRLDQDFFEDLDKDLLFLKGQN